MMDQDLQSNDKGWPSSRIIDLPVWHWPSGSSSLSDSQRCFVGSNYMNGDIRTF